jgi:hypothetical protein
MAILKDFKIKTSPQAVNLVSSIMDAQGLNSNNPEGINQLFYMLHHNPSAGSRGWLKKNEKGELQENEPEKNNKDYNPYDTNHAVVEEVARKRVIDHLDHLSRPNELYLHLGKINSYLGHHYRDAPQFNQRVVSWNDDVPEVATTHTILPRDEQEKLLHGVTKLINHPHFADGATQHGPSYMGKRLSNKNHLFGRTRFSHENYDNPTMHDHQKLFSTLITHDDLRDRLHDTLDQIETRSPAHKQMAAAIRGHMLQYSLIHPKELTRLTKKFVSDTDSIDVGRYGLYGKKPAGFIGDSENTKYEYHTPEEIANINKSNTEKTWGNTHGIFKERHTESILKYLSHTPDNIHAHSTKDHMDHMMAFEHIVKSHPNPEIRAIADDQGIKRGGGHLDKTFVDYLHRRSIENFANKLKQSPESRKSEFTHHSDNFLNTESQTRMMASRMYHAYKQMKQISKMI